MRYFLSALVCIMAQPAFAQDAPDLVLIGEKSLPSGLQQTSVEFRSNEVVFVTNTNAWQSGGSTASLGFFTAKKSSALKTLERELEVLSKKDRSDSKINSGYVSPHSTRLTIQGRPLKVGSSEFSQAEKFFEKIWRAGEWQAKRGVRAAYEQGKTSVVSIGKESAKISKTENECRPVDPKMVFCTIGGFGYAYFERRN